MHDAGKIASSQLSLQEFIQSRPHPRYLVP